MNIPELQGNVLITGGLGLVGSNLARRLANQGVNVTILTPSLKNINNLQDIKDKVSIIQGEVQDFNKIQELVKDKQHVFHLAGVGSHKSSMDNPFLDLDIHVKGTLNILEACRKHSENANIVFSGTIRQAGVIENTYAKEEQYELPVSNYDAHRLLAEKHLRIYNKMYGLPTTTLRLSNIFGDGQYNTDITLSPINHITKQAVLGNTLKIYGDGGPLRDYNYVGNIVDALIVAADSKNTKGEFYITGSGQGKNFKQFMETLSRLIEGLYGRTVIIEKIAPPEGFEKTAQQDVIADYSKFNKATGWVPRVSFEEGLKRTIEYYKKITSGA